MNEGARTQASSLLRTRSELEVLAQASEQNSHLARQAKRAAEAARENAKSGAVAMETMARDIRTAAAKETSTWLRESSLKIVQGMSINTRVSHNLETLTGTTQGLDVSLRDISSEVFSVDDFMNQVVDSCEQQSTGIASIRVAVGQVDDVIQGSLARADEYSSAANSLIRQACPISDAVNQVEGLIGSRTIARPHATAQLEF
jgi:methyl-accepting chemotaxis protein